MASIVLHNADLTPPMIYPLERRVLRIGAAPDNEIVVTGAGAELHHAHIVYDKQTFTISPADSGAQVVINGKKRRSHKLTDGDVVQIGDHILRFVYYDHNLTASTKANGQSFDLDRFEALHRFATKLMSMQKLDDILEALLDELIALTGADKAFLLLTLGGEARVHASRNVDRDAIADADAAVSDSIVQRVLSTGEPLIVADALSDTHFRTSHSVMNLKLCSVMCVPLTARGSTLGLFYLGNDNAINHFTPELLEVVNVFAVEAGLILDTAVARNELVSHIKGLRAELAERRFGEIIGACDAMRDIFKKINRVATTDISVLVEGETGTGKELVARAIHQRSNRADGPFVVINCGAIPENLLESELFGHMRGAFTGAVATTQGKFQAANKGTLFLDEIGEMPLQLQVKILRAIQERTVMKVGDTRGESIDVRFLAATNKHLVDEIAEGRFREDLYYRLNVVSLNLPPLRERDDDIVLIANYFLSRYGQAIAGRDCTLSQNATRALKRWRWPGNIRELENRIKKAVVFSDNGVITPTELDLEDTMFEPILPLADARENWQRGYINQVLALNDGNRTKTARDLDVDPRTIFRHLEKERTEVL